MGTFNVEDHFSRVVAPFFMEGLHSLEWRVSTASNEIPP